MTEYEYDQQIDAVNDKFREQAEAESFDKTTVFLDFETNGFQGSDVLSVAAIKDSGEVFERYYYPEGEYNEQAVAINGLTEEKITELRGDADYAEHFKDDKEFVNFMKDADVMVAHNAAFDHSFLPEEVKEQNLEIVDTMKANMDIIEGKAPKLSEAAEHYGVEFNENDLHGALADAKLAKEIYEAMPEERREPNEEYLTKEFAAFNEDGEMVQAYGSLKGVPANEYDESQVEKFFSRFDSEEKHEMFEQVVNRAEELGLDLEKFDIKVENTDNKELVDSFDSATKGLEDSDKALEAQAVDTIREVESSFGKTTESENEVLAELANSKFDTDFTKEDIEKIQNLVEQEFDNTVNIDNSIELKIEDIDKVLDQVNNPENDSIVQVNEDTLNNLRVEKEQEIQSDIQMEGDHATIKEDTMSGEESERVVDRETALNEMDKAAGQDSDKVETIEEHEKRDLNVEEKEAELLKIAQTTDNPEVLDKLAEADSKEIIEAIKANENVSQDTLEKLNNANSNELSH